MTLEKVNEPVYMLINCLIRDYGLDKNREIKPLIRFLSAFTK